MTACEDFTEVLVARALGVLEDGEIASNSSAAEAHAKACASCAELAAAARVARAELELSKAPDATRGWDELRTRIELDRKRQGLRVAVGCSYCHDDLGREEAVYCASCLAAHHADCFSEHGRCSAPGCGETRFVESRLGTPSRAKPRRRTGRWILLGASVLLGGGAIAALALHDKEVAQQLESTQRQVAAASEERARADMEHAHELERAKKLEDERKHLQELHQQALRDANQKYNKLEDNSIENQRKAEIEKRRLLDEVERLRKENLEQKRGAAPPEATSVAPVDTRTGFLVTVFDENGSVVEGAIVCARFHDGKKAQPDILSEETVRRAPAESYPWDFTSSKEPVKTNARGHAVIEVPADRHAILVASRGRDAGWHGDRSVKAGGLWPIAITLRSPERPTKGWGSIVGRVVTGGAYRPTHIMAKLQMPEDHGDDFPGHRVLLEPDEKGEFFFHEVLPGRYHLVTYWMADEHVLVPHTWSFEVKEGAATKLDLPVIEGRITLESGAPLPKTTRLEIEGERGSRVIPYDSGEFALPLESAEAEEYHVLVRAPGFGFARKSIKLDAAGNPVAQAPVVLDAGANVTGRVVEAGAGQPLERALVVLRHRTGDVLGVTWTGEDGRFQIAGAVKGKCEVWVAAPVNGKTPGLGPESWTKFLTAIDEKDEVPGKPELVKSIEVPEKGELATGDLEAR